MIERLLLVAGILVACNYPSICAPMKKGDLDMNKYSQIRMITLEKAKVASYCFQYSKSPEGPAIEKIAEFARVNGILDTKPKFYGFNNPEPHRSPKKPEYGYEYWVTVGENIKGNEEIKIKETESGDYLAMYGLKMNDAWDWMMNKVEGSNYNAWSKTSGYEYDGSRQWLDWQIYDETKYPKYVEKSIVMLYPMKKKVMRLAETNRLIVRAFAPEDWDDVHALAADWSKAPGPAFDKWPTSEKDTKGLLDMFINKSSQFSAIQLKETNHVIGLISLTAQNANQSEIGHVILSKYQNNDIDKEAIGSVVDYTFTRTEAQSIITHNAPGHMEQIRPLKNIGFINSNAEDKGEYVVTKADWQVRSKKNKSEEAAMKK